MHQLRRILTANTFRLAATYLAIIMVMSVGFSIVFFQASYHQLGRQVPPHNLYDSNYQNTPGQAGQQSDNDDMLDQFFQQRVEEGRADLLHRLVLLNVGALLVGSYISYLLARYTLRPIEENMEAQLRFVSDASHELRTPLTALRTTNEVTLRRKKITEAEARDLIGYNVAESVKLKELTDALLGLLKEEPHLHEPVSLKEVLGDSLATVEAASKAKNIKFKNKTIDAQLHGSKQALSQVLTILLDNAIKYSPVKSTISIEAEVRQKKLHVSVADQGIGISPDDLPHIFDRFYRSDKARSGSDASGFGLGLAIAKKITDAHHGHIEATSVPGKGSTFTLILPLT